jgi:hypothetical protein
MWSTLDLHEFVNVVCLLYISNLVILHIVLGDGDKAGL